MCASISSAAVSWGWSAAAQPSAPPAVAQREQRYPIGMMERVLESAVEHGAAVTRDRLQALIPAEMLLDCISQVTNTKDKFQGLPLGARAVQIADGNTSTYFLTTFGRATRETVCSCEVKMEPTLSQALHLLNSNEVQQKVTNGNGRAAKLATDPRPDAEKVEELFLWAFARKPSAADQKAALAHITANEKAKKTAYENILWALLNTKEFAFNQ